VTAANLNEQLRDNLEYLKQSVFAILVDQKAQNVGGGTMAGGAWTTHNLQTELADANNIVVVSTNQFTPISGLYRLWSSAIHFASAASSIVVRNRLRNVTTGTTVHTSMTFMGASSSQASVNVLMSTLFSANGTDAFAIQYYSNASGTTSGAVGQPLNESGAPEIYTTVLLEKLS
jgi:hypothetical protein